MLGGIQRNTTGYSGEEYVTNYSTTNTNISSSATANAYGSWVQLISDVGDRDVWVISVIVFPSLTTPRPTTSADQEFQLGIGAASSEEMIFTAALRVYSSTSILSGANEFVVPGIIIPANSRLSARFKDSSTSANNYLVGFTGKKI